MCFLLRSGTGSNDPVSLQTAFLQAFHEDSVVTIQTTPRRKMAISKKLTPKKVVTAANLSTPDNPALNTRSKKKLQVE